MITQIILQNVGLIVLYLNYHLVFFFFFEKAYTIILHGEFGEGDDGRIRTRRGIQLYSLNPLFVPITQMHMPPKLLILVIDNLIL